MSHAFGHRRVDVVEQGDHLFAERLVVGDVGEEPPGDLVEVDLGDLLLDEGVSLKR
ncbi:hypothetical protein LZG04_11925 [Saccharothrix sp. S26]|uniref:hypothetical protein n=1 Tax=Saccharothrix sp. S26 TaxID=2907215 RepID=UPI001F3B6346|nr:hypothetical protein [Saccharothrix sp. S26]MCE6995505.1 hypothetical protein [Saccharothrix sp. S26]